jgi:hypothetical protein
MVFKDSEESVEANINADDGWIMLRLKGFDN